jgi:hypothetical protein
VPCYSPISGWRTLSVLPSGKRGFTVDRNKAFLLSPLTIPCGGCIGCRLEKSRQWATRIVHENKFHELSVFLTLTYAPEKLPSTGSISKPHLQLFLKRLRQKLVRDYKSNNPHWTKSNLPRIRYFACGEYGDDFDRPHYHAIIFGMDFSDKKQIKLNKQGDPLYMSETLNEIWGLGHCWIGQVTNQSAEYCARYIMKKVNGSQAESHYQKLDSYTGELIQIQPEFIAMSRYPPLGQQFYEKFKSDLYPSDQVIINGKPAGVPKRYNLNYEKEAPEHYEEIKDKRKKNALKRKHDNTPERLAVKHQIRIQRIQSLKRDLTNV